MTVKEQETMNGHEGVVTAIRFSPNGCMLASASVDRTAWVWRSGNGLPEAKQRLEGHTHGISDVCWHPSQQYVATASDDLTLGLWDVETGKRLQTLKGHTHFVFCCKFHTHGSVLVSGSLDESVRYWDIRSGHSMKAIPAHSDPVTGLDVSKDGQLLATASSDGLCRLWDFNTGHLLRTLLDTATPPISSIQFSANDKYLMANCLDEKCPVVKIWDWSATVGTRQGYVARRLTGHDNSAYFLPATFVHGNNVLCATEVGSVCLWNINSGKMETHSLRMRPEDDATRQQRQQQAAQQQQEAKQENGEDADMGGEESGADGTEPAAAAATPAAPPKPDAVNAMDVHEGTGRLAYSHIGCRDHAVMLTALPSPVT